jgi:hypothetical protein
MKEWFEGKTVALIGNAMSLFDKEYGHEIDSHEVVVRLNRAAMLYDREDVLRVQSSKSHGSRTDVWMFWNINEYVKFMNISPSIKKMHMCVSFNVRGRKDIDFSYPITMHKDLKSKSKISKSLTTGFMSLDYINNCNPSKLYVYGFDWKETPTFTDPLRKKDAAKMHDFDSEREYCVKTYFNNERCILRK